MKQYIIRSRPELIKALDEYVHHNGVSSRNALINHILKNWIRDEQRKDIHEKSTTSRASARSSRR